MTVLQWMSANPGLTAFLGVITMWTIVGVAKAIASRGTQP